MVEKEAENLHEELMQLLAEDDENFHNDWTEYINFNVDEGSREINEYLIPRKVDPSSDTMSNGDINLKWRYIRSEMGGKSINNEALAAGKHKEIERQQLVRDQTTIKNLTQISNSNQQQRANPQLA